MQLKDFIKGILLDDDFNPDYVEELLRDDSIILPEDEHYFQHNKRKIEWKTRIKKRLGFKSFSSYAENYWIFRGYNYSEAREICRLKPKIRNNSSPMKTDFWIAKGLSLEESERKIKSLRPFNTEYWEYKGYTFDEAKEKVRELQIQNSEKMKRSMKEKPLIHVGNRWNQKLYWMKRGLSEEDAIEKVSSLQKTFSLEKCIEKYGIEEGTKKWSERQLKWSKSYKKTNFSKVSQELFWLILESDEIDTNKEIYFATYDKGKKNNDGENREYTLKVGSYVLKPDFIILKEKKIIEFDGTYWHNHKKRNKPENKKREMERDKKLKDAGYQILRISESDFYNSKEKTVGMCIDFINLKK